jgi:hypothetical protein
MLVPFSPQCLSTSTRDIHLPAHLRLSLHRFNEAHSPLPCFLGTVRFWGGTGVPTKWRAGKHSAHDLNTTEDNMGLTDGVSTSPELQNVCWEQ